MDPDRRAEYVAPKDPINNTRCVCCGQDPCKRQFADTVRRAIVRRVVPYFFFECPTCGHRDRLYLCECEDPRCKTVICLGPIRKEFCGHPLPCPDHSDGSGGGNGS